MYGIRYGSNFSLLFVDIQLSQFCLLKRLSVSPENCFGILIRIPLNV